MSTTEEEKQKGVNESEENSQHSSTAVAPTAGVAIASATADGGDPGSIEEEDEGDNELPQTFPQRLYEILSNDSFIDVIGWLEHGKGFMIRDKKAFAERVLPKYFKKSKFTSFTRKLNRWNYTRVTRGPETGAYYHPLFQKGNPNLIMQMSCINAKHTQQIQPMDPIALGMMNQAGSNANMQAALAQQYNFGAAMMQQQMLFQQQQALLQQMASAQQAFTASNVAAPGMAATSTTNVVSSATSNQGSNSEAGASGEPPAAAAAAQSQHQQNQQEQANQQQQQSINLQQQHQYFTMLMAQQAQQQQFQMQTMGAAMAQQAQQLQQQAQAQQQQFEQQLESQAQQQLQQPQEQAMPLAASEIAIQSPQPQQQQHQEQQPEDISNNITNYDDSKNNADNDIDNDNSNNLKSEPDETDEELNAANAALGDDSVDFNSV